MLENVGKSVVLGSQVAGTGALTTDSVDCAGLEGVQFAILLGADATGDVTYFLQDSDDDSVFVPPAGASVTATSVSADGVCVFDLARPVRRYNRLFIVRGSSIVVAGVIATLFAKRDAPATDGTGVESRDRFTSPS